MRWIILILFLIGSLPVMGQNVKTVKPLIKDSFYHRFPNAVNVLWDIRPSPQGTYYNVRFFDGNTKRGALFDSSGHCVETAAFIRKSALPNPILKKIRKKYSDYKISDIMQRRDEADTLTYHLALKQQQKNLYLTFSATGKLLRKKEEESSSSSSPEKTPPKKGERRR